MNIKKLLLNASSILAITGIGLYLFILNQSPKMHYPWQGFYYQSIDEYADAFGIPKDKINTQTFTLLSDGLAYDKNHIYFGNTILPYQSLSEISDKKSQLLNDYQKNVCGDISPIWDINTLEILDIFGAVTRDNNNVYLRCNKTDIPINNIQILAQALYTNGKTVFNENLPSQIHLNSFQNLGFGYIKDAENIYTQPFALTYEPFKSIDAKSFIVINGSFARDKNHYFYKKTKLTDIDYETFKPFTRYAVDKNRAYYFQNPTQIKTISNVDYESFEEINKFYAKGRNNLYYTSTLVPNINIQNITMNDFGILHNDTHVIIDDEAIIVSDPNTFQKVGKDGFAKFYKDQYQVYFKNKPIPDADPKTFELIETQVLGRNLAKDINGCFQGNQRSQCSTEEEINNL